MSIPYFSQVNKFLEEKAAESARSESAREEVMDQIQRDLGERLRQSRDELAAIKAQMKDTERGVQKMQVCCSVIAL